MLKLKGKKVLVVGLGKSGQSTARFLVEQGAKVTVTDTKNKNELSEILKSLSDLKIDYDLGRHTPKVFTSSDYIVLSPGVPSQLEPLMQAREEKIPIINDLELLYHFTKVPIVAVTGTNGKTTTTALISEMLKNDGKKVFTGGNFGIPALQFLIEGKDADVLVLEVSSFQAECLHSFKPKVAVFTNLEPDHLDRYPDGPDSYYTAKKRLIAKADKQTTLVTNLDDERTVKLADEFPGMTYFFTKKNPIISHPTHSEKFQGAYLNRPQMVLKIGKEEVFDLTSNKLPGDHNRENLMAAAIASFAVGGTKVGVQKTIETFRGVSHRLEFIRRKDGVSFYNDSKATNVASVLRSLSSFSASVILIAGGRDKDQDFTPLAELVKKRVKNLILLGEAKEKINRAIGDYSETFLVGTFEEGVLLAYQKSRNGDVILLSPSCASYDMFKNYEERGDYFKKIVSQL